MKNKYILESLASDLKRVAIGKHRGSSKMADRFLQEALKRKDELELKSVATYIKKLLNNIDLNLRSDDALMYSTLIQNYTRK
jgi:hypothetical protein